MSHAYDLRVSPAITLPTQGLIGEAVELRPLDTDDVPAFVEALRDPGVGDGAYHGRIPARPDPARAYIARNPQRMAAGTGALLAVWEPGAARLSGQTMLFNIDWEELTTEIGFWTAPWARGRRLSVAALCLTVALAFDRLGLGRVSGLTGVENRPAQLAMERAGLLREGVLRGLERTADGRLDQVSYAILSTDPRP